MSTPDTKLFDGFPITYKDGKLRALRAGESLCKFNCNTITNINDGDGAEDHCGSCCPKAVELRTKRVAPIHEKSIKEAEARVKKIKAALASAAKPTATPAPK